MDRGVREPAEILGDDIRLAEQVRRAAGIEVDAATLDLVERQIDSERPALSEFYPPPLGEREGAGFLRYESGGFYRTHRDRAVVASWPAAERRRIAVVVFLNSSRDIEAAGNFSGGMLRLVPDDEDEGPIEIRPRAGMLVAFPATTLHEVTVVEGGTRDTIVDWFY